MSLSAPHGGRVQGRMGRLAFVPAPKGALAGLGKESSFLSGNLLVF